VSASVTAVAPAKVNLSLAVGAARADGFHALATVYQAIGIHDEVTVRSAAADTVAVVAEGVDASVVPLDPTNLALRAARLLAEHSGVDEHVEMTIRKRIPVAGGMAGGSADAAAALVACDALWGLRTPSVELMRLAAGLGSDVPFCLVGGTAIGSGRGEVVTPAMTRGTYWWVVAPASGGLATPQVYAEFDRLHTSRGVSAPEMPDPEIPDAVMAALCAGDHELLGKALTNDLQPAACRLRPDLEGLLDFALEGSALGAMVSGSGPTCLFLAGDEQHAEQLRDWLEEGGTSALVAPGPVPGARVVR
jgi:4-diphosphocytidyl-2-C-methyl-D-erythritol kinase